MRVNTSTTGGGGSREQQREERRRMQGMRDVWRNRFIIWAENEIQNHHAKLIELKMDISAHDCTVPVCTYRYRQRHRDIF